MITLKKESEISNRLSPTAAKLIRSRYFFYSSRCPTMLSPSLAVVRQSLRLCASMVLKSSSLFHISWAVSVSHPTISTSSDCVTFQGNEDPREIAVSSPILRAFQVDVGNRAWDVIKMTCLPHYANL